MFTLVLTSLFSFFFRDHPSLSSLASQHMNSWQRTLLMPAPAPWPSPRSPRSEAGHFPSTRTASRLKRSRLSPWEFSLVLSWGPYKGRSVWKLLLPSSSESAHWDWGPDAHTGQPLTTAASVDFSPFPVSFVFPTPSLVLPRVISQTDSLHPTS